MHNVELSGHEVVRPGGRKGRKMGVVICFGMAAVNILCALVLPLHPALAALNLASAVFCFGIGLATAYVSRK